MPRLFVALALPPDVRLRLAGLCNGVPGAHWVGLEQFHLTLRFVGEVDGTTADDVADTLDDVTGQPFELKLKGVDLFDKGRNPTALWVGIAEKAPLVRLHEKIDRRLGRVGLEPEARKFHPHVSLARLKGAWGERVAAFLAAHAEFALPPIPIAAFHLYSSHCGRDGAHYRIEQSYPLAGA
ncbi:MAG: RNA 2',3'-cyclic phosphodiesterase [Alphaproteobacteria bacterium]|nr:RNA 2',3'-cyclic phosphodiesterase [Alphaproteobacteria bacterium]